VRLARDIDREKSCHDNVTIVHPGKSQRELRCATCGVHRGWLSKSEHKFLLETAARFGAPSEPTILRQTKGHAVSNFDNTNKGALFKNSDKTENRHPDYRGNINVNGVEMWLSAWIKTSAKGVKYMSLAVQPKTEGPAKKTTSARADLSDKIPF
jgi:uncharacterized protein (DUF736 family)